MRKSLKNQLNTWRTANNVGTMQDVLDECTHPIKNEKTGVWALVVPSSYMSIKHEGVIKVYMAYRVEMIKYKGMLRNAVANDDTMEQELLRKDMIKLSSQFFSFLRKATGQDYVMGINHDLQGDLKTDGLLVNIYPIQAKEGESHELVSSVFKSRKTEKVKEQLCVVIPYKKGGKKN